MTREKRVLFVQHGNTDKPGLLGQVLEGMGILVDVVHPYLNQSLPALGAYDGLALGGGGQSAYEQDLYPYMVLECDLVRHAAHSEKPVLGLCLGAQLMAFALGGNVRRGSQREIGFFEVKLEPIAQYDPVWCGLPESFVTTHWHGDVFDIPAGGMRLGSSKMTPNQLFRYGHALYGLQFHLEMTPDLLDELVEDSQDYLRESGVDPVQMRVRARECLPHIREMATTIFSRWGEML